MQLKKKIRIGVIGGSKPDARSRQVAFNVGQLIAEKGAILICGGLSGVMEAASRGAKQAGGLTIGILQRGAKQAGGLTIGILPGNSPQDANPNIDIPIATGLGYGRNSLVAMNSDVIIAVDGQYGTLTEIAYGRIY